VELRVPDDAQRGLIEKYRDIVENAAKVTLTVSVSGDHVPQSAKSIIGADLEVVVPLAGLIDIDAERARIKKELGKTAKEIAFVEGKLNNKKFIERAPADVVEKERERLVDEQTREQMLKDALEALDERG